MQDLMVDVLWNEDAQALPGALERHLASCPSCDQVFHEMREAVRMASESAVPSLPDAYWDTFYDRLVDRMQPASRERNLRAASWLKRMRESLVVKMPFPAPIARIGFAMALVLAGVLVGRYWEMSTATDQAKGTEGAVAPPASSEIQLTARTQRYLDRSNVLLLGLVNFDTAEDDPSAINLGRKKVVAAELVEEARLLKADLGAYRERQLVELVEDLERILLQIANLEAQHDLPSIEVIQRGVDRGSLLLKINLEQMRLVDRPAGQTPSKARPSTGML